MGHTQNPTKGHTSEVRVNHPYTEASAAAGDAPVDNSAILLQMPLQAERIAEWIRLQERQRGCRSKAFSRAAQIAAWLALAVTGEELREAYSLAKGDREVTQNRAPINLPFLDIFVRRVIAGQRSAGKGAGPTVALWHATWDGLNEKAKALGVPPWRADGNEGFVEFQQRVMAAHRQAAGAEEVAYG